MPPSPVLPAGWGERSEPRRGEPAPAAGRGALRSPRPAAGGRTAAGFTLLELMVVLVIVGIVLTFVTLSVGGDRRGEQLDREARRLAALLELASEEAVLKSRQLAVRFERDGYLFLRLQGGQWLALAEDPQLRERRLPDGVRLELELDDSPLPDMAGQQEDAAADATDSAGLPQVFLLSSGEMTPFRVVLSADETDLRPVVRADLLGRLEVE